MKKIILGTVCTLAAIAMVGCSNGSSDAAIKNLSNQLDRVTNTVSSISTTQLPSMLPSTVSNRYTANPNYQPSYQYGQPTNTGYTGSTSFVSSQINKLSNSVSEHDYLRSNLLSQTAMIKNQLSKKPKLSKNQVKALNGLTNNISKFATNLNNTKNDITNSVKMIKKNSSPNVYNETTMGSYYLSLNNHLDARLTYIRNLMSSLDQVGSVLGECDGCYDNAPNANMKYQGYDYNNYNNYNYTNNYYALPNNETTTKQETSQKETKKEENKSNKNIDTYQTNPVNNKVNENVNTNNYPQNRYGNRGYNNAYNGNYNNGYYNNGYGTTYYNSNGLNRTPYNPSRNTDTYGPGITNIDTYRVAPNANGNRFGYYGNNINMSPVKEVSSTELDKVNEKVENKVEETDKVKENKIISKVEENKIEKPKVISHSLSHRDFQPQTLPKRTTTTNIRIDRIQTNKNIEKLIKG